MELVHEASSVALSKGTPFECFLSKFTDSKQLGKHVMQHIDEDFSSGSISCRQSEAEPLRRAQAGLGMR